MSIYFFFKKYNNNIEFKLFNKILNKLLYFFTNYIILFRFLIRDREYKSIRMDYSIILNLNLNLDKLIYLKNFKINIKDTNHNFEFKQNETIAISGENGKKVIISRGNFIIFFKKLFNGADRK